MIRSDISEIAEFVAEMTGTHIERIKSQTTLFGDLGVDGDDAVDLIEEFARRFNVDMAGFDFSKHFGPEYPIHPGVLFYWLVLWLRKGTPEQKARLAPISIADLAQASLKHKWNFQT